MGSAEPSTVLPPSDAPYLSLELATPEERVETVRLNSASWRGPLSVEQYAAREQRLSQQNLTRNGALLTWVLVDSRQPPGKRTILSACETFRKPAYVAYKGKVEDIVAYGVGSVFARPEFRGRGYAGRMMTELAKKIDRWQEGDQEKKEGLVSVLFSDVGKKFYAKYGWKPFPSSHVALPPITPEQYQASLETAHMPKARELGPDDVRECMCSPAKQQKFRDVLRQKSLKSPQAQFTVAPDYDHLLWHWARDEFYQEQGIFDKAPALRGAGVDERKVYCAWTRTVGESPSSHILYILRWVYDEPTTPEEEMFTLEAIAAVLRRAQYAAHQLGMSKVEFWNPTPLLEKAAQLLDPTTRIVHREQNHITCLKWNGAARGMGDDVEWVWNEKYSWC